MDGLAPVADQSVDHLATDEVALLKELEPRHAAGKRVAIWGGGSKGVSFCTTDGLGPMLSHVVDINPYKQGKYLPGAGLRVSAPEDLAAERGIVEQTDHAELLAEDPQPRRVQILSADPQRVG